MKYLNRYIKVGEANAEIVIEIQKKLNTLGIVSIVEDGIFDSITKSAIKLFQSMSTDSHGNPLVADGIVGAITWEALFGNEVVNSSVNTAENKTLFDYAIAVANS